MAETSDFMVTTPWRGLCRTSLALRQWMFFLMVSPDLIVKDPKVPIQNWYPSRIYWHTLLCYDARTPKLALLSQSPLATDASKLNWTLTCTPQLNSELQFCQLGLYISTLPCIVFMKFKSSIVWSWDDILSVESSCLSLDSHWKRILLQPCMLMEWEKYISELRVWVTDIHPINSSYNWSTIHLVHKHKLTYMKDELCCMNLFKYSLHTNSDVQHLLNW